MEKFVKTTFRSFVGINGTNEAERISIACEISDPNGRHTLSITKTTGMHVSLTTHDIRKLAEELIKLTNEISQL